MGSFAIVGGRNKHKSSANSQQSCSHAGMRPINRQKNTRKNINALPRLFLPICSAYCLRDYSTIVATLPEPTVRPPSRSFELVLVFVFHRFWWKIWGKLVRFYLVFLFTCVFDDTLTTLCHKSSPKI